MPGIPDNEHDKDKAPASQDAETDSEALSDLEAAGSGVAAVSPELVGLAFPFRFVFTAPEFGRASAYHFAWQFRFLYWPARLVGLFLIVGVAIGWTSRPPTVGFWTGMLHLFSGVVMLTYLQLLVWASLGSFRKSRLHGLEMSIIMRGDGLHIRSAKPGASALTAAVLAEESKSKNTVIVTEGATATEGEGQGDKPAVTDPAAPSTRHMEWENFRSAVLFPGGVLLYQTSSRFHWLPYSGMLPPARSTSAEGYAPAALVTEGLAPVNPTQLLEDFLRIHVPSVSKM